MERFLPIFILACLPIFSYTQADYFQQEVNYHIEVTLDDSLHYLHGTADIVYHNHSPHSLDSIYFHLWANAFSNRASAFNRQKLRTGSTRFYFADQSELGNYTQLDFQSKDRSIGWRFANEGKDIAVLSLPSSLASGDSMHVHIPFTLKIPASFSRLGHVGESYQMTQWYPKPAVYDQDGWHPMPYLDMGEYYSEFGSFDVKITLPENYVVGATGKLQTESEREFLNQIEKETDSYLKSVGNTESYQDDPFPPSSKTMKTLRFTAERVHDFAWFADKRFRVQRSSVALPSGRKVDTWVMFTKAEEHLWKDAITYVDRSVSFYSEMVGEYPYPQATAVQSALSAGGGMEYPMITVIGLMGDAQSLDEVITHEVGHNWFYGILAFNERDHPWLDEGINSYYDHRYSYTYYGEVGNEILPGVLTGTSKMGLLELGYLFQARRRLDQAPATHSDSFTMINYFLGAYEKPARALKHLESYLGAPAFDRIMRDFYQDWQFRHPQPRDFRNHFAKATTRNLDWFFDGFIQSSQQMDYRIKDAVQVSDSIILQVKNTGEIDAPFPLSALKDGKITHTQWFEGFKGERNLRFPAVSYDQFVLDAERKTLEVDRKNNTLQTNGVFKKLELLQIRLLPGIEDDQKTQLFISPILGWNNYDKLMPGLLLYNPILPFQRFRFSLAPMYGLSTNSLNGVGSLEYHHYPQVKAFREIVLSLNAKGFSYERVTLEETFYRRYWRFAPKLDIHLGKPATGNFHQVISWRSLVLQKKYAERGSPDFSGPTWTTEVIHELSYQAENRRSLNPFQISLALEQQSFDDQLGRQHYLKASLEFIPSFTYQENKNIVFRFFLGGFLRNSRRNRGAIFPEAFPLIPRGFNDYRFDGYYFGRTEGEGFFSQQVGLNDGGLKTPIGKGFPLGNSNSFIAAINMKADLPFGFSKVFPLKPYLDLGYFDNAMPTGSNDTFKDQFLWNGGLMLDFFEGMLSFHFPLVSSKNLQDRLVEGGNYWTRVSFQLDLHRLNPWTMAERFEF